MQQTAANPYQRPGAAVADEDNEEFSQVKILSAAGRIGRVRYIGYSIGMTLVFYAIIALGGVLAAASGIELLGAALIVAAVIGMLIVGVMLTIQRCHDFDVSGWLSLLLIVPLAPLLFWIIPGTKGSNRFGAPTPPNSTGVVILALVLPVLFFVGIIAAIALPAYQDYVKRARMVEEIQQPAQAQEEALDEGLGEADAGDGIVAEDVDQAGAGDEVAEEGMEQAGAGDEASGNEPAAAAAEPAQPRQAP